MNSYAIFDPMQSQEQNKCLSLHLILTYVSLPCSLAKKDIILQAFGIYFFMPHDALNGSLVEQCVSPY